jgi:hypothetical protein
VTAGIAARRGSQRGGDPGAAALAGAWAAAGGAVASGEAGLTVMGTAGYVRLSPGRGRGGVCL